MANRIDYTDTAYEVLVEAFGPPGDGDPDKTLAQWDLQTPDGWVEVYDYKAYPATRPEDVEEWHVQAERDAGFERFYEAVREASARLGTSSGGGQED